MSDTDDFDYSWRLKKAVEYANLTQGEVAQRIETSQSAVSQWCAGKKMPSDENFASLANALGVRQDWLQKSIGPMKAVDESADRQSYEQNATWAFRKTPADGGRDYGNANVWSFDPSLEALVREVLQNARDAGPDPCQPVQVVFRIVRLVGDDLLDFQKSLRWDSLRSHLEGSIVNGQKLGTLIKDGLEEIASRKELLLLTIDDTGTTGLLGPEKADGKFMALCRNNLDSKKDETGTRGGAFGLGKAVLWRASRLSTVLFCSNLSIPEDGQASFRILGRCDLPWHKTDNEYAGPGWFGQKTDEEGDAVSFWENETLARDLYLYREGSGTTACVVGFHDPSADRERPPMELAQDLVKHSANHFFPALAFGTLKVNVEVYESRRQYLEKRPGFSQSVNVESMKPHYCKMLRAFRDGATVEQMGDQDEVVSRRVKLDLPRLKSVKRGEELEHEAVLLLSPAGEEIPSDASGDVNRLSMFRGPGMVIDAVSLSGICLGARPFVAMLLCGKAIMMAAPEFQRNPLADSGAEEFLRTAEPPSHNGWIPTAELKSIYALGCKKRLEDFLARAKQAVRELVKPIAKDLGDGPEGVKEMFRIGSEPTPTERPKIIPQKWEVDEEGRWIVEARIRLKPKKAASRVSPAVFFVPETGNGQPVAWESLEPVNDSCTCDGHDLIIPPNAREIRFRGKTNPKDQPISAHESCIVIDLRKPFDDNGGSQ